MEWHLLFAGAYSVCVCVCVRAEFVCISFSRKKIRMFTITSERGLHFSAMGNLTTSFNRRTTTNIYEKRAKIRRFVLNFSDANVSTFFVNWPMHEQWTRTKRRLSTLVLFVCDLNVYILSFFSLSKSPSCDDVVVRGGTQLLIPSIKL